MRRHVLDFPCSLIYQGYLHHKKKSNLRIRQSKSYDKEISKSVYMMTYKQKTINRVVEINTEIDERDFIDLWVHCKETLKKYRYFVEGWDVDFFLDDEDEVYFVLAECEMPEGQDKPDSMPDLVAKSLLYEVPRDDNRFSSRRLADVPTARKLLRKVISTR